MFTSTSTLLPIRLNGSKVWVEPNTTILQAAETKVVRPTKGPNRAAGLNRESNSQIGYRKNIPRYCVYPTLSIAGNCRICFVEVKGAPKPIASCAIPISPNIQIFTHRPLVAKARERVGEFLLLNHPLDCPICDQGGECDLQDQTYLYSSDRRRFFHSKRRTTDKNLGPVVKTIITRCIHCTRCVRFLEEVDGKGQLAITGRGSQSEITTYSSQILTRSFRGNLIDLCPVGALTSKILCYQSRPWETTQTYAYDTTTPEIALLCVENPEAHDQRTRILPANPENFISDTTRYAHSLVDKVEISDQTETVKSHVGDPPASGPTYSVLLGQELTRADLQLIKYYFSKTQRIVQYYTTAPILPHNLVRQFFYQKEKTVRASLGLQIRFYEQLTTYISNVWYHNPTIQDAFYKGLINFYWTEGRLRVEISTKLFSSSYQKSESMVQMLKHFQQNNPTALIHLKVRIVNEMRYVFDRPTNVKHLNELLVLKNQPTIPKPVMIFGYLKPKLQASLEAIPNFVLNRLNLRRTKPLFSQSAWIVSPSTRVLRYMQNRKVLSNSLKTLREQILIYYPPRAAKVQRSRVFVGGNWVERTHLRLTLNTFSPFKLVLLHQGSQKSLGNAQQTCALLTKEANFIRKRPISILSNVTFNWAEDSEFGKQLSLNQRLQVANLN